MVDITLKPAMPSIRAATPRNLINCFDVILNADILLTQVIGDIYNIENNVIKFFAATFVIELANQFLEVAPRLDWLNVDVVQCI